MNKMEKPVEIDLDRHGVIEAHAGTGKTWTVVQMVLRIIEKEITTSEGEKGFIPINKILLVTFTEKASGELKERIRKGLEERIRKTAGIKNAGLKNHLETCLNNLHEALIGTIHGICLRLLQTCPFETGVPFITELVDDSEGLADALRESMRTDWQDQETLIPWALEQMQAQGTPLEEKHFGLVRETAFKLLDRENTVLDRRACEGLRLADLKALFEKEHRANLPAFILLVKKLKEALDGFTPPAAFHENAGTAIRAVQCWSKMIIDGKMHIDCAAVASLSKFKKPDKNGKLRSTPLCDAAFKKTGPGSALDTLFRELQEHVCIASLETIEENLSLALICDAAVLLRDRWIRTKREKGLISFQDMLHLMHKAIMENPGFCALLRERLCYGIIDEFQDTSSLQWRIFKKIFLDAAAGTGGPRIFIVGDPKQSIYSFQGADVGSYLDAKSTIVKSGGKTYPLTENFRSLRETISGYNAVFAKKGDGPDWFAFNEPAGEAGGISYPSAGEGGEIAEAHPRSPESPLDGSFGRPVQVMVLEGNAAGRLKRMAAWTALAVGKLIGRNRKIKVPDGDAWKEITLTYEHFAVIVEKHRLAGPFLEEFQKQGISAVKYKMEGVFQSAMARDLHALLRSIVHPVGDPAPRLAALLTVFFNCNPVELDPELALEPCRGSRQRCGCMFHALEEWTFLASRQLWSQLFKSIDERTRVRERLISLKDGKRRLADLRQVTEYSIEKLYRGNYSLEQLVEHLGRLLAQEERAGLDENLHVLATGKSCVKVLTMHAAKGLEFPVVFVVTGGSEKYRPSPGTLCWMDGRRQVVMPSISFSQEILKTMFNEEDRDKIPFNLQDKQERRRLLYVALTRAQALLFVPAHVESIDHGVDGSWVERCPLPGKSPDNDLTPKLLQLLENENTDGRNIGLFDATGVGNIAKGVESGPVVNSSPADADLGAADIKILNLPSLVCRETSYTELSREATVDRKVDRSEEIDGAEKEFAGGVKTKRPALPGGKDTGDALHLALEAILQQEDIGAFVDNDEKMEECVTRFLHRNGILKKVPSADAQARAITMAIIYVRGALTTPIDLPTGERVSMATLEKCDRVPEMEFHLGVAPHWVHGYMDLVFRVKNDKAQHPYRYFVLDWKSDQLDTFDKAGVEACIESRHYNLQAKIYCHALDKYLQGVLGDAYDPVQNLGGAAYVFLRSFTDGLSVDAGHFWTLAADPEGDSDFTAGKVHALIGKNTLQISRELTREYTGN